MKTELEAAIKILTTKINADVKGDDALKFSQACLNLAHVIAVTSAQHDER